MPLAFQTATTSGRSMPRRSTVAMVGNTFSGPPTTLINRIYKLFIFFLTKLSQQCDFLSYIFAFDVYFVFLHQLSIVTFLAGFIFIHRHRTHGSIWNGIVYATTIAHPKVEDTLKIVHRLNHCNQVVRFSLPTGYCCKVLSIPIDMLHYLGRFLGILVVCGNDVIPG